MNTDKKKIIFFGDSITQQGTEKADGFVNLLRERYRNLEISGSGIGGNKVYDLYLRLYSDVLSQNPFLVVIFIGINDVWHKLSSGTGTDYAKFIQFYQAIIDCIKTQNISLLLCTPSLIGELRNNKNELDRDLDFYADGIRKLAEDNDVLLCDLREKFLFYEEKFNKKNLRKGILTNDGIHLNKSGNYFLAEQFEPFLLNL